MKNRVQEHMPFSWEQVLSVNPATLLEDPDNLQDEMDKWGPCLTATQLSLDKDATPEHLLHVFRLSQVIMQYFMFI